MPRQTITTIVLLLFFITVPAFPAHWRTLAPGVEYIDLNALYLTPWSHIHAFRIDPTRRTLSAIVATSLKKPNASVHEFAEHAHALIAINGGFFDKNSHPLGLRITHQSQLSPLKNISWWGVFYIQDQKPHLASMNHYQQQKNIDFAIQSGPRLLVNGHIPSLKPGKDERSALGITKDGKIILIITENTPITTTFLAQLMQKEPLSCKQALNLDGGSSSQLHADVGSFQLDVPGFSNISDAVVGL